MPGPWELYDLLIDYAAVPEPIRELVIGPIWTLCRTERAAGLAMSPQIPTRTLEWSGTLAGRAVGDIAPWIKDWEPYRATVGMAAVNAVLAGLAGPSNPVPIEPGSELPANLAVFEHFLPQLAGREVVVVGRYPDLDRLKEHCRLTVLERNPAPGDLPDPACEYVFPGADWVFLTGSAITNKTFPRLASLARSARTVLMGPTVPWLPELADFGIDYLAGVEVVDTEALRRTLAEGGGVRIFEGAVRYRITELNVATRLDWFKRRITVDFAEKERLTVAMEAWYQTSNRRFPHFARLEGVRRRLARLDSGYKILWDEQREKMPDA